MAEVDAPRPKPGSSASFARSRSARNGVRPPPGPAAPISWLHADSSATDRYDRKMIGRNTVRDRPIKFCELAKVNDEEFKVCFGESRLFYRD
jgi:hypothetical protein